MVGGVCAFKGKWSRLIEGYIPLERHRAPSLEAIQPNIDLQPFECFKTNLHKKYFNDTRIGPALPQIGTSSEKMIAFKRECDISLHVLGECTALKGAPLFKGQPFTKRSRLPRPLGVRKKEQCSCRKSIAQLMSSNKHEVLFIN